MQRATWQRTRQRKGIVAVMVAFLAIPMFLMVAFSVDYGLLVSVQSELQRAAEAAALAAVVDLVPNQDGDQTQGVANARTTVKTMVNNHVFKIGSSTNTSQKLDVDVTNAAQVEIGVLKRSSVYTDFNNGNGSVTIDADSDPADPTVLADTVRVTLGRGGTSPNDSVSLFFAKVMGIDEMGVQARATATLRAGSVPTVGTDIIPLAVLKAVYDLAGPGGTFSMYGDKSIEVNGVIQGTLPAGGWGQVDIGDENNAASDLTDQIVNGLRQSDLDALFADGRTTSNSTVTTPLFVNGDTGFNANLQQPLEQLANTSEVRLIPIYDVIPTGQGENVEFHIVDWGLVRVNQVQLTGNPNKRHVTVERMDYYYGPLAAVEDLQGTGLPGTFTSPALVE
jgi:Flp pilus assembly protein TadG